MSFTDDMREAACDYAAGLRKRGYRNVGVFRYSTALDNREPGRRDHRTASGYAVRYTSSVEMDAEACGRYSLSAKAWRERRGKPLPKLHDRSVTVFTAPAGLTGGHWLTRGDLTSHAGILADFAGEVPVPMYTAASTPGVQPENVPAVPSVIMKRFPVREGDYDYPFQGGPTRTYHLVMTPYVEPFTLTLGPRDVSQVPHGT